MSAVENLIYILSPKWVYQEAEVPTEFYQFQLDLFKKIDFQIDETLNEDERMNVVSSYLQFLACTICANFVLRNEAICRFVELGYTQKVPEEKVKSIIKSISANLGIDFRVLFADGIRKILGLWIMKEFQLKR